MENYKIYIIHAKTNMHVGSGETNFNIVDNQVQRDVIIPEFPIIHASSLKGALREFYINNETDKNMIDHVFGSEEYAGMYKFFEANLLTLPVRSNKKQYFMGICPYIIRSLISYMEDFSVGIDEIKDLQELLNMKTLVEKGKAIIFENIENVKIENISATYKEFNEIEKLKELLGEDIALLSDDDFKEIAKELPVIARNKLKNGLSENLWYEEIVPRASKFYFAIGQTQEWEDEFNKILTNNLIQIGANASIGYGFTKIVDIEELEGEEDDE